MSVLELRAAGFAYGSQTVLEDVSLSVDAGESVGLVGESGAGKSTILRLLLGLSRPRDGEVRFDDAPLALRDRALMRRFRSSVQPVLQDPQSSPDPRQRTGRIVGAPLRPLGVASGAVAAARAAPSIPLAGDISSARMRFRTVS